MVNRGTLFGQHVTDFSRRFATIDKIVNSALRTARAWTPRE